MAGLSGIALQVPVLYTSFQILTHSQTHTHPRYHTDTYNPVLKKTEYTVKSKKQTLYWILCWTENELMYIRLHMLETGNDVSVCLGLKRRVIGLLPVYISMFFSFFKSITIAPNFKSNYLKGFKRALVHLAWKTCTSAKALLVLYIITVHGFWRDDCPHSRFFREILAHYTVHMYYTCTSLQYKSPVAKPACL